MGIFDSIKNAFGTKADAETDITSSPSQLLQNAGLDASGLQFEFGTASIMVSGEIAHENDRQKILDILATAPGINSVQDNMSVAAVAVDTVSDAPEISELDTQAEQPEAQPGEATYVVQFGDRLWNIAESQLGDGTKYMAIYEANKDVLESPDHIVPGQELVIPRIDE